MALCEQDGKAGLTMPVRQSRCPSRVNPAMSSAKLGIGASTVYGAENTARANPVEGETETTR